MCEFNMCMQSTFYNDMHVLVRAASYMRLACTTPVYNNMLQPVILQTKFHIETVHIRLQVQNKNFILQVLANFVIL